MISDFNLPSFNLCFQSAMSIRPPSCTSLSSSHVPLRFQSAISILFPLSPFSPHPSPPAFSICDFNPSSFLTSLSPSPPPLRFQSAISIHHQPLRFRFNLLPLPLLPILLSPASSICHFTPTSSLHPPHSIASSMRFQSEIFILLSPPTSHSQFFPPLRFQSSISIPAVSSILLSSDPPFF